MDASVPGPRSPSIDASRSSIRPSAPTPTPTTRRAAGVRCAGSCSPRTRSRRSRRPYRAGYEGPHAPDHTRQRATRGTAPHRVAEPIAEVVSSDGRRSGSSVWLPRRPSSRHGQTPPSRYRLMPTAAAYLSPGMPPVAAPRTAGDTARHCEGRSRSWRRRVPAHPGFQLRLSNHVVLPRPCSGPPAAASPPTA